MLSMSYFQVFCLRNYDIEANFFMDTIHHHLQKIAPAALRFSKFLQTMTFKHQRKSPHSANFSKPPRPLMYCLAVSTISL